MPTAPSLTAPRKMTKITAAERMEIEIKNTVIYKIADQVASNLHYARVCTTAASGRALAERNRGLFIALTCIAGRTETAYAIDAAQANKAFTSGVPCTGEDGMPTVEYPGHGLTAPEWCAEVARRLRDLWIV